jgi:hypothetical protein
MTAADIARAAIAALDWAGAPDTAARLRQQLDREERDR